MFIISYLIIILCSLHCLPLKGIFVLKDVFDINVWFILICRLGILSLFLICDFWGNETIRITNSPGELSHRIYCGPSQIYFYWSSEIFLWDDSSQFLFSLLKFSHVHISLLWIFILTPSLVKMTIIIRMSVLVITLDQYPLHC